jgi:hypothetical protein
MSAGAPDAGGSDLVDICLVALYWDAFKLVKQREAVTGRVAETRPRYGLAPQ